MTGEQGWHNDPQEHDLARQGIKTKRPGITEADAEKIVTAIKGKSPTHDSQARSQMTWYDELWLDGKHIPEHKISELEIEDMQVLRSAVDEHIKRITANTEREDFFKKERDRLKGKTIDKLRDRQKNLEEEMAELKRSD